MLAGAAELKAETLGSTCFINYGHGNFTKKDLPEALQLAPVFSFASFPNGIATTYFAAGNFYGVFPYEGRYDVLYPSFFNYDKKSAQFNFLTKISAQDGEVRDAKWINYAGKKTLLIARNNSQLIFLKPTY